MTSGATLVVLVLLAGALAIGVRLYVLWKRAERARAILDDLINANRARPRPGMERRDDRFTSGRAAGPRRPSA